MCGIAGTIDLTRGLRPAEELGALMTDMLQHRGPDDAGVLVDGPVTLGHRRLSIIDLSPAGHQPMPNVAASTWITFNGEVYNYIELRKELQGLGRTFRTATDTEVILEAYAAWGTGMLERLNGMFAFALWDRASRNVLLARDRFGVKPLYYTIAAGRLRFASEIKALLVDPAVARRPNDARVLDFLANSLADHSQETMFDGVMQLAPGTYLELTPFAPVPEPTRWYRPKPAARWHGAAAEHLRGLLESSVALRLRSDVPVGVALSGGMDSSAVLALACAIRSHQGGSPPQSFSARSADPGRDEYRYSETLVRSTGSQNFQVLPTFERFLVELDPLLWHMDEPFSTPSTFPELELHGLARAKGIVVLLNGVGGDEVLAGYHHFHYPGLMLALLRRGRLLALTREMRARRRRLGTSYVRSAKDVLKAVIGTLRQPNHPVWIAPGLDVPRPPVPGRSLAAHQDYALELWPLPAYNHYADRTSMAVSLEARNPFLDVRVVEAGRAMYAEELLHDGFTKWALREAVRDVVPREIVDRAEKQGFTSDFTLWLRGDLADMFAATFAAAERPYFDRAKLLATLDEHRSGAADRAMELWRAFVTIRWLQVFVDPERLVPPPRLDGAIGSDIRAAQRVVRLESIPALVSA
jgi:asparagine synthase (glutamine-hydrolysing)